MQADSNSNRQTTMFMRQLVKMLQSDEEAIEWLNGIIIISNPNELEKILPKYFKTSKFASFQRQLNNFGYHRCYSFDKVEGQRDSSCIVYKKMVGSPPCRHINGLLSLRPLERRKKRDAPFHDDDGPPRRKQNLLHHFDCSNINQQQENDSMHSLTDAALCLLSLTELSSLGSLIATT